MRRRVVVDASVLAAVAFAEASAEEWRPKLEGAEIYAPSLLRYEMANVARKHCRERPEKARDILAALDRALDPRFGIKFREPNQTDVVLLSTVTRLSPYDASYLYLAGFLGADLLTADQRLAKSSRPFAGDENGQYLDDGFDDEVVV